MLVAISIPIFTSQLEKSRDAVTASNLRAAYAEAAVEVLEGDKTVTDGKITITKTITVKGTMDGGMDQDFPFTLGTDFQDFGNKSKGKATAEFVWTVAKDGTVAETPTVNAKA